MFAFNASLLYTIELSMNRSISKLATLRQPLLVGPAAMLRRISRAGFSRAGSEAERPPHFYKVSERKPLFGFTGRAESAHGYQEARPYSQNYVIDKLRADLELKERCR